MLRRGRCPPQSPAPGFGEKYWSLSGFPSHSLESGGGAFLTIIFGQIFAYSAFSDSHFSSPGSVLVHGLKMDAQKTYVLWLNRSTEEQAFNGRGARAWQVAAHLSAEVRAV